MAYQILYGNYYKISETQTSATSPYTVSTNNYYGGGYEAFRVFDGAIKNTWGWCTEGFAKGSYIQVDYKKKVPMSAIKIYNGGYGAYTPKEIVVTASNDGSEFIEIATLTHLSSNGDEILDFGKVVYYRYYRFVVNSNNNGNSSYIALPEMECLCTIYMDRYILDHNGVYKTLNGDTNELIEVESLDYIKDIGDQDLTKYCIDLPSLYKKSLELTGDVKILVNNNTPKKITGIVNEHEMIVTPALSMKMAKVISSITTNALLDADASIKFAISIDGGEIYKVYDTENKIWVNTLASIPNSEYKNFSATDKNNWNAATDLIATDGNDIKDMGTIDFNIDGAVNNIKFAFVFISGINTNYAKLTSLSWVYDEINRLKSLSDNEVYKYIYGDTILIEPKANYGEVYVNISTQDIVGSGEIIGSQTSFGPSVPDGGTTGQVLAKVDNTDGNVEWVDQVDTADFYTKTQVDNLVRGLIMASTVDIGENAPLETGCLYVVY